MKRSLLSLSLLVLATACSSSDPSPLEPTTPGCPAPTGPVAHHHGEIVGQETWSADQEHVIDEDVYVRDGAQLTIASCAVVSVASGKSLHVLAPQGVPGTSLVAEGTADRPIRFQGQDGARWDRLYVVAPATARLAHTTFTDGGSGDIDARGHETIGAAGDSKWPAKEVLSIQDVSILRSGGAGLRMDRGAVFSPDSRNLLVKDAGRDSADHPYPIEVTEASIDSLPVGSYTGNQRDEILLVPDVVDARSGFQQDATIHDRGVPYHVGSTPGHDDLGVGHGEQTAVLTIEAGVELRFEKQNGLLVRSEPGFLSGIRALGTAEKPVVFTSAASAPAAGDWRGLMFVGPVSGDNLLDHVRLEYTGAECLCSLVTCSGDITSEAAIIFEQQVPAMFLRNSVITHGSGHGVYQGFDGTSLDFRATNAFEDVSGCFVTEPRQADTHCPAVVPSCR